MRAAFIQNFPIYLIMMSILLKSRIFKLFYLVAISAYVNLEYVQRYRICHVYTNLPIQVIQLQHICSLDLF